VSNSDAPTTGPAAQTYSATPRAPSAAIAPTAIIDAPFRPLLDGRRLGVDRDTVVKAGAWIGEYTIIGRDVTIGTNSIIEDFVRVEPGVVIGPRVLVSSGSWIGIGVAVGQDSVIRGRIGDNSRIGAGCRIFGDLIHRQLDPSIPWDDPGGEEPAPIVDDGAFVGWGAVIVGGVTIGAGAYICAGALITKNVPAGFIGCDRNRIMHPSAWPGQLGQSPFLQNSRRSRPQWLGSWRPSQEQDQRLGDPGGARPAGQRRNYLWPRRAASDQKKSQALEPAGRHRRLDG